LFSVIPRVKGRGLFCEAIQFAEVEISMVRAEALGDVGSGGTAEHGRIARSAAEGHAAQKAGREGIAAPGCVDDLDVERRHARGTGCVDDERAVRPGGGGDTADALGDQLVGRGFEVGFAREPKYLLLVGQQVVEVLEHGPNPVPDGLRLLARCEQVGRRDDAMLAGERGDLRRFLAAHELRRAEVQVRRVRELLPRHVAGVIGGIGADDMERRARAVGTDRQDARRCLDALAPFQQRGIHAGLAQERDERVAQRVAPDRAGAAHAGPELGQRERGAAGRPGRRHPDLLDQRAALTGRYLLHRPDQHIEHVHAERDRRHRVAHGSTRWVLP
jgi:hypothetical protein